MCFFPILSLSLSRLPCWPINLLYPPLGVVLSRPLLLLRGWECLPISDGLLGKTKATTTRSHPACVCFLLTLFTSGRNLFCFFRFISACCVRDSYRPLAGGITFSFVPCCCCCCYTARLVLFELKIQLGNKEGVEETRGVERSVSCGQTDPSGKSQRRRGFYFPRRRT